MSIPHRVLNRFNELVAIELDGNFYKDIHTTEPNGNGAICFIGKYPDDAAMGFKERLWNGLLTLEVL